jgi:predicted Rossmann fold flavoprotein
VTHDVIVIGAGAAGIMAAIHAASAGVRTMLLERTADGGRKILISGGGRCNILPARVDESRFVTDSSCSTLRRLLRSWPLHEQMAFFEEQAGIRLVEEPETAKLFPASQQARDVRDRLLRLARERGASFKTNTLVTRIEPSPGGWSVTLGGEELRSRAVVLATGGMSVPKTGSDGLGLRLLEQLGHRVHPTYPALTPLTMSPNPWENLAGVSLPVTLTARTPVRSATAAGGFLFTHDGYSGPAVLDVSHVVVRSRLEGGEPARLVVRWTPLGDAEWEAALRPEGTRSVQGAVAAHLPDRLAGVLVERAGIERRRLLSQLTRPERLRLVDGLIRGDLPWTGDEGYRKAEVTGGGVDLDEVDPRTLESRRYAGLFLCGELLDAFGPIGGYNFFWAWATGRAAGHGAAAACSAPY